MTRNEELTELLHRASRAVGDDLHADPAALISAVRHRRRAAWLCATAAALVLLAAVAVPSLADRDRRAFNVAAGDPNGGAPTESTEGAPLLDPVPIDPTSTTWVATTVAPEPAAPPASAPPTTQVVPPPTSAPPVTREPATTVPPTTVGPLAPPTTKGPAGEPELLSASGTVGRITLHFSRPVVPGDGPSFDRPTTAPSTDTYMAAMQLVSHMLDSTCSSPNGNAHEYLSGVGTDTITVEASSLVVGTTYISISPGFVKNPVDGTPMKWVRCLGITIR